MRCHRSPRISLAGRLQKAQPELKENQMHCRRNIVMSGKIRNLKLERQVVGRVSRNLAKFVVDDRNITYPFLPDLHDVDSQKIIQNGDIVTISGENNASGVLCFAIRNDSSKFILAKIWWESFLIFIFIMTFDFSIYESKLDKFNLRNIILSPIPKLEIILALISIYFLIEAIRCYNHNKNVKIKR